MGECNTSNNDIYINNGDAFSYNEGQVTNFRMASSMAVADGTITHFRYDIRQLQLDQVSISAKVYLNNGFIFEYTILMDYNALSQSCTTDVSIPVTEVEEIAVADFSNTTILNF